MGPAFSIVRSTVLVACVAIAVNQAPVRAIDRSAADATPAAAAPMSARSVQVPTHTATSIAAGSHHTCAVTDAGGVVCWGNNGYGRLGDGTNTSRSIPTPVVGLSSGVTAVAAGEWHTCALTTAGGVLCWGNNNTGQLGDGTLTPRFVPTPVSGLASGVTALAAGEWFTCATTAAGGVKCWGNNSAGQLGVPNSGVCRPSPCPTYRTTPIDVSGTSSGVSAIAAGIAHTCALTTAGSLMCWGANGFGQLGDGTQTSRYTPMPVSGLESGVAAVVTRGLHTCALTSGGAAVCWGFNSSGQLGDGTTTTRLVPTPVTGLSSGVTAIASGVEHTCALTEAGGVTCWGRTPSGQFLTPTAIPGLANITAITAGWYHTCALADGGGVKCVGSELGDGATTGRLTPTWVSGRRTGIAAISAGGDRTCALTTEGGIECWGRGVGRAPTPISGLGGGASAVAVGRDHTCAITTGGALLCWGDNSQGQVGDGTRTYRATPTPVQGLASGVVAVSAGEWHTCAITTGGATLCWGSNGGGRLGDGTSTDWLTPTPVSELASGVASIAAGGTFTCAVTSGGAAYCWGSNSNGQLGDGTMSSRAIPSPVSGLGAGVAADHDGRTARVRTSQWRRRQMLGLAGGRRHDDEPLDADLCHRSPYQRGGNRRRTRPHMHDDKRARGHVLGCQRVGSIR